MSFPYTEKEIDQIEEDFRNLNLKDHEGEIIQKQTTIELIEENDIGDLEENSIKIVKQPTKVEFVETE